ncbi:MAG: DASS family sodium-coupled anion symporter [bacterium]
MEGLPPKPGTIYLAKAAPRKIDWKRIGALLLGIALFCLVYYSPSLPDGVTGAGDPLPLTHEGKAALAVFALALTWWIFEVIPLGVTGVAIGVAQAFLLIRPAGSAFEQFMHPSVWFVFGSLVIGLAFNKTGLTKRAAYRMLTWAGERTRVVFLGCMVMTAALTHVMAHTAVAASVFPLLRAIHSLYEEDSSRPSRFGKALFISMAFTCGAASIITLLGSARGALALGIFHAFAGKEISFFRFSWYMFPLGWVMVLALWIFFIVFFPPERRVIPGLHERAKLLHSRLGPMSGAERMTVVVVAGMLALLLLQSLVPALGAVNKSAVILVSTILFFVLGILSVKDFQELPWNLVLFFGGAMSIGLCLHETGAAAWLAARYLSLLHGPAPFLLVMATALVVLLTINWMMNVAVIALAIPVGLLAASYGAATPEMMLFACLATAGMPFLLLYGSAPNVIAYGSGLFTQKEFLRVGVPASLLLMAVLALFVWKVWPAMGLSLLPAH